ncbi:MAG: TIGR02757 family protein [Flavisolibacter sp.]
MFIEKDPISIPHFFTNKKDIEIAGLFASIFAWGHRTIIIKKSKELMTLFDNAPYQFIQEHEQKDLKRLEAYKHRTFNSTDLLYFIHFLKYHYSRFQSLETAFTKWMAPGDLNIEKALIGFHNYFFSLPEAPHRSKKHISTPLGGSTCKRINMYLRWMVRKDNCGVDFGLWNTILPSQLICPIDLHVARVARRLHLIKSKNLDWQAALQLTKKLTQFDKLDPVKYDFALFGLGAIEKF